MGIRRHKSMQRLAHLFQQIFQPVEHNEGILFVSVWPTDGVSAEDFEYAIQRAVSASMDAHSQILTIWRLRNTSPAARGGSSFNDFRAVRGGPWALLVRGEDMDGLQSHDQDLNAALNSTGMHDASDRRATVGSETKHYQLVQRFEGKRGTRCRGSCIVAVSMSPAPGQEVDLDSWYRKENLPLLAANPTFIRSTRYIQEPSLMHGDTSDRTVRMLALHEYTSSKALLDHAIEHGPIAEETPWSKRIFETAIAVERTVWDVVDKQHRADVKVDKL